MMLFLVSGKVEEHHYMEDDYPVKKVMRLVEADNEDAAMDKFIDHYESQSRDYDVHYWVKDVDVTSVIS